MGVERRTGGLCFLGVLLAGCSSVEVVAWERGGAGGGAGAAAAAGGPVGGGADGAATGGDPSARAFGVFPEGGMTSSWFFHGAIGLEAGKLLCRAAGADHVCE